MSKSNNGLSQNELFGPLTEQELSKLAPLCSTFSAAEEAALFLEGRFASHLYLVTEGQIALQKRIRVPHATRPKRMTVTVCRAGEVVGWSALVEPYKYTLSAVAWDASRLIRIDAKMLRMALNLYPEIGYKIMGTLSAVMSRRLRQITEALISQREVNAQLWPTFNSRLSVLEDMGATVTS